MKLFISDSNLLNAFGFANYCLEFEITVPTLEDYERYIEQGGWKYYQKHIENATGIKL